MSFDILKKTHLWNLADVIGNVEEVCIKKEVQLRFAYLLTSFREYTIIGNKQYARASCELFGIWEQWLEDLYRLAGVVLFIVIRSRQASLIPHQRTLHDTVQLRPQKQSIR